MITAKNGHVYKYFRIRARCKSSFTFLNSTLLQNGIPSRALDIGCAVGRSSFEMTRLFKEVVGIDYSHSFIAACDTMKGQGQMAYSVTTEGDLRMNCVASLDATLVSTALLYIPVKYILQICQLLQF